MPDDLNQCRCIAQVEDETRKHHRRQQAPQKCHLTGLKLVARAPRNEEPHQQRHHQVQRAPQHHHAQRASHRHLEKEMRGQQAHGQVHQPHAHVGNQLGQHDLQRPHRRHEKRLHRAALPFTGNEQRGEKGPNQREHQHQQPRHQEPGALAGLVEPKPLLHLHAARRQGLSGRASPIRLLLRPERQHAIHVGLDGGGRRGFTAIDHQLHRRIAGLQPPGKVRWHPQDGLHLVPAQPLLGLQHAGCPARLHVGGTTQPGQHLLHAGRRIFQHHRHPHVLHVEGHAVAKQQDQCHRQRQAHQQIAAVTQHLMELLLHKRPQPVPETRRPHEQLSPVHRSTTGY